LTPKGRLRLEARRGNEARQRLRSCRAFAYLRVWELLCESVRELLPGFSTGLTWSLGLAMAVLPAAGAGACPDHSWCRDASPARERLVRQYGPYEQYGRIEVDQSQMTQGREAVHVVQGQRQSDADHRREERGP
jgi:hypothetical protein